MTQFQKPNRLRKRPLQIYLSEDEYAQLMQKCADRGVCASDLVRRWILAQPRKRGNQTKDRTPADPRQTTITGTDRVPTERARTS